MQSNETKLPFAPGQKVFVEAEQVAVHCGLEFNVVSIRTRKHANSDWETTEVLVPLESTHGEEQSNGGGKHSMRYCDYDITADGCVSTHDSSRELQDRLDGLMVLVLGIRNICLHPAPTTTLKDINDVLCDLSTIPWVAEKEQRLAARIKALSQTEQAECRTPVDDLEETYHARMNAQTERDMKAAASDLLALAATGYGYDIQQADKENLENAAMLLDPESVKLVKCEHGADGHSVFRGHKAAHDRIVHGIVR